MRRPDVIVWDWDNTLVDGWTGIAAALNVVLAEFGMPPWTVAEARERVRGSVRDVFPVMFGDAWRHARALFAQ
jgi:phosphoglycolate phosphatase